MAFDQAAEEKTFAQAAEVKTQNMKQKKTNSKGESHCFNCGAADHWSSECPHDRMTDEQRAELAAGERKMLMNIGEEIEDGQEGVQLLNVMLLNNGNNGLSDDRLYLDNCSTVTAVKNKEFLKVELGYFV